MTPRRHIDLFSGIGGFALAAYWAGYQTEVFCEQDEFCKKVLNRHWPAVPIIGDIRDFDGSAHTGADLLTGGFPCQPFSTAGKRQGSQDDRFLWPEMFRVISEARPTWIVGENVAGIINMALDGVLADLESEGYTTQSFVIPACAVNAPHRRDRVWIVAYTDHNERHGAVGRVVAEEKGISTIHRETDNATRWISGAGSVRLSDSTDVADAPQFAERKPANQTDAFTTCREARDELGNRHPSATDPDSQPPGRTAIARRECGSGQSQPRMGDLANGLPRRLAGHFDSEPAHIPRIATGVPQRSAKLKALGNAIVPQVAYEILRCIPPHH